MRFLLIAILSVLALSLTPTVAQSEIIEICPNSGIQPRPANFEPAGIILTAFDSSGMWVYDIERNARYPLPQTAPCTYNCNLSPDAQWITYVNPETYIYGKMRLTGVGRTPITGNASEVSWWSPDKLLIWTPDSRLYLIPDGDEFATPEYLPSEGVLQLQPRGKWAVAFRRDGDSLNRYMVNLDSLGTDNEQWVILAPHRPYFNHAAWSPDGQMLAYVGFAPFDSNANISGGELYLTSPETQTAQRVTSLTDAYGAVRINGYQPNELSWSPDGTRIAFWVTELNSNNPEGNLGDAVIHLLDTVSGQVSRYCGFSTNNHTPNPPRLVWSPDGTHIAFAGDVANDERPPLLLAMNVQTGQLTELSNGIFPAPNIPDVTAWGYK